MTETPVMQSLAIRAKRLAALSRAKSENAKEVQEAGQTETALGNLKVELAKLTSALAAHRKMREAGIPVDDLPNLMEPATRLRDHMESTGRPSPQFLNARKMDVSKACAEVTVANRRTWQAWAGQQIAELPLIVQPKLSPRDRAQVARGVEALKKAVGLPQVSSSDVTTFRLTLANVAELLSGVEATASDDVLSRFEGGRIKLSRLSDEELVLLRADQALADQLYVVIS